jgi:hypothetical protein
MNVFHWLGLALKWGPHVISAVYLIESLFGGTMTGPEKKEAVLAWLRERKDQLAANGINLPWGDAVIEVISNLIDTVVGLLNLLRVFRRKDEEANDATAVAAAEAVNEAVNGAGRANVMAVIDADPELTAFVERTRR